MAQEKAAADRKELIREAAISLFAQRGFMATSTSEIAKLAGVSEGIIFYHFQTKEGILISLLEKSVAGFLDRALPLVEAAPDGLAAIMACLKLHLAAAQELRPETMVLVRDLPVSFSRANSPYGPRIQQATGRILALLEQTIAIGQTDGSIRPCDQKRNARLVLGMMAGMSRLYLLGIQPSPELGQDLLEFCRRALAHS